MFRELERNKLSHFQKNKTALSALIRKNASIKSAVVRKDEFETGERRLLNFGHTLGHAIENMYVLGHGEAISIGMAAACRISEKLVRFKDTAAVIKVLNQYGLPTELAFDKQQALNILKMDKKRERTTMNYVLLEKIGKGVVKQLPVTELEQLI